MKTLPPEPLESRIAPAAIVFDVPEGDGAPDEIAIERDGAQLVLAINGVRTAAWEYDAIDALSIGGSGDDDTLVVNFDSGEVVPAGGLFFDGRAGFDSLDLRGGSFEREVSTPFDAHSGTIALDDRLITYAGIEPVTSTTAAATFVIDGTAMTDLIVFINGAPSGGFQTITVLSGDPSTFESVTFANKQVVIVQGLVGNDSFDLGATTPATGLAALILHGHSGTNAGDDAATDTFNLNTSLPGVAIVMTGGGGPDQFQAGGATYNRTISFDGQAGTDIASVMGLTISGSTGDGFAVTNTETVSIETSSFTDNTGEGIVLTSDGTATLTNVTSTGNLTGLLVTNTATLNVTGGLYRANDDHGIQLVDHLDDVTLTSTTLALNDADNDGNGDGFSANTIGDDLFVRGAVILDGVGATEHQERGIFVGSIAGEVTIEDLDGLSTSVSFNESDGVRIDDGGALATITLSSFNSNLGDGMDLRSFDAINVSLSNFSANQRGLRVENSTLSVTDSTHLLNSLHGLSLANVTATLTNVTATDNTSRGIVADLTGASTITGGLFLANGSHGLELRGNSAVGTLLTLSGVTATMNGDEGLLANGFTDSGSTAPEVTITGGTFSQNGVSLVSSGINLSADIGDALLENLTVANNPARGINVDDAASVTLRNVTLSLNGLSASDPTGAVFESVGLVSYTPTAGAVDDTFELSASGSLKTQLTDRLLLGVDVDTLELNGGDGRDVFKINPQTGTTVVIDGGAPTTAPGDVLEYNTERRTPTQTAGSITAAGVMPVNFSGIESVSINNNGLRILNPKTAVYRDVDGDNVTLKVNRGALEFSHFTLDPSGAGSQLQTIDFTNQADLAGANLKITAKRDAALGGDSFANVGFLNATGLALGNVKINGDLGRIAAGNVKSLAVQSIGVFGTATQDPTAGTPTLQSEIIGSLGKLTVKGDLDGGMLTVKGVDMATDAEARIGSIVVGGSLIGGGQFNPGSILATGGIGPVKIAGSVLGGTFDGTGVIASGGRIGAVKIGGSFVGGAGAGSGLITSGSSLPIAAHIASVKIAGDLIGGAGSFSGSIITGPGGRVGNVTIGGSFIAGSSPDNGIQSDTSIGAVKITGDVRGTIAAPAMIVAQGILGATTAAQALAIKSLSVGGRVENVQVLAGYKLVALPPDILVLTGTNPDAQIGPVNVGSWIASSLVAGAAAGADGFFGTDDDAAIAGGSAAIVSRLASVVIKGQLLGGTDIDRHFGFVAEQIGSMKIGTARLALEPGPGNDNLTATDPRFTFGILSDVTVREVVS